MSFSHFDPQSDFVATQLMDPTASLHDHETIHQQLLTASSSAWSNLFAIVRAQHINRQTNRDLMHRLLHTFIQWGHRRAEAAQSDAVLDHELLVQIRDLYLVLRDFQLPHHDLLTALAVDGTAPAMQLLATLLCDAPPLGAAAAAAPIAMLFGSRRARSELLFPRVLDALVHVDVAPAILDLANFLTRQNRVAPHPAHDRSHQLIRLLEGIVSGLEQIQQATQHGTQFDSATQQKLSDGLSLAISICDALGLIGDERAISCLQRVAQLQHRRLRVEALAALGRLGNDEAKSELATLAAESSVRLRVLAYCDELGCEDLVSEQYKTPVAIASAELASVLASPARMGLPPTTCELIDTCTQYWPGYDEPRICFLFRYSYRTRDPDTKTPYKYENIGIAGPVVQALPADLNDLPVDDIYAVYAGWHAEHEELYEVDWNRASDQQRRSADRLLLDLENDNFENLTPLFLSHFFGDWVLIATAKRDGVLGTAIVDHQGINWHPHLATRGALGPLEFYCLYKGRRLLRTFNG